MQDMNMESEQQPMPDDGGEPQGIDGIISIVDGYIAKPETITPETLQALRDQLQDLKSFLEPEDSQAPAPVQAGSEGGLAGMIGGR